MKLAIFRRKFDEILPEFRRNVQDMTKCLEILRKVPQIKNHSCDGLTPTASSQIGARGKVVGHMQV